MRQKLFLVVVVCLVCFFSVQAQTVIETESNISFGERNADLSLVLENSTSAFDAAAEFEVLDGEGKIRAKQSQNLRIGRGKETYKIALAIGDLLKTAEDEIAWYRLHYRVGRAEGFISLSELMKDVFELRVATGESVFSGT